MHAVLLEVDLSQADREEALKNLRENVVPQVSAAPGFKAGYWLAPIDSKGVSVVVFETEENARAAASVVSVGSSPGPGVTVSRSEVREVVASA